MDILTTLDPESEYSTAKLQLFLIAWVLSAAFSRNGGVSASDGNVDEGDYSKQSLYSLLYSMYRSIGEVKTETGETFELTFNTWGYAWPERPGPMTTPRSLSSMEPRHPPCRRQLLLLIRIMLRI